VEGGLRIERGEFRAEGAWERQETGEIPDGTIVSVQQVR